jgi:predicted RNA binding protein YcfA (HicA-like mRNA interferase family)
VSLRPLSGRRVIKVLTKIGFRVERRRGSHVVLKHRDGRVTVVPVHSGEKVGRGLLLKIVKDAKLTREEFLELLREV